MDNAAITIGQLSDQSGVKIETIRYYEKIGLLPKPPRTSGGHRVYYSSHIQKLAFIRRARELGFPISDIRSLLGLEDHILPCSEIFNITERHLLAIRSRLSDLKKLESHLEQMMSQCNQNDQSFDCSIIDALYTS